MTRASSSAPARGARPRSRNSASSSAASALASACGAFPQRPEYRYHVWAYDFVADRTHDGRPLTILTIVEAYSREYLAIVVARGLRSIDVLETLAALFVTHGVPAHLRSDNGPEFTAELIRLWLEALQV